MTEFALRREVLDRSLSNFTSLVRAEPTIVPEDIGIGYKTAVSEYVSNLFVPNIEYNPARHAIRLSTPKEYQGTNMLGIMAVHSGETVYLDETLASQTDRQAAQSYSILKKYRDSLRTSPEAARKTIDEVFRTLLICEQHSIDSGKIASVTTAGISSKNITPTRDMDAHRITGRPILFVSLDDYPKRLHPATLGHEADHAIVMQSHGMKPMGEYADLRDRLHLELRGYHVGARVLGALQRVGYDSSHDGDCGSDISRAMETIRTKYCTGDDPFEPNDEVLVAIISAGLGDVIGLTDEECKNILSRFSDPEETILEQPNPSATQLQPVRQKIRERFRFQRSRVLT